MTETALRETLIPELGIPRRGKVRDIYENGNRMTLISTDRISIYDRVLARPIPDKGKVLTKLSLFWFEKTADIVPNHILSHPDPNVVVVKKCRPIMVEMIVRGYLVGSLWRDYRNGKRSKCGIPLPEGLKENDPLPSPIVTPTTKSVAGHDEDIAKEELIRQGIVTEALWNELEKTSLALYQRGREVLDRQGLILVDTKYEFGLDEQGQLTLIDEIHTPDSSRYWFSRDLKRKEVRFPDKEFVREWGRAQGFMGDGELPELPEDLVEKVSGNYKEIYRQITGESLAHEKINISERLIANLKQSGMIEGYCCLLLLWDESHRPQALTISQILKEQKIPCRIVCPNKHQNLSYKANLIEVYNQSLEPVVMVAFETTPDPQLQDLQSKSKWSLISTKDPEFAASEAIRILKPTELK